jgi:hypothetical protein
VSAKAFKGREKVNELRLSLDPEDELLCMLSPLQVIYAQKIQSKRGLKLLQV